MRRATGSHAAWAMQGGQAPKDWYGEAQYGFYDLLISKTSILITSINWRLGSVMLSIGSVGALLRMIEIRGMATRS